MQKPQLKPRCETNIPFHKILRNRQQLSSWILERKERLAQMHRSIIIWAATLHVPVTAGITQLRIEDCRDTSQRTAVAAGRRHMSSMTATSQGEASWHRRQLISNLGQHRARAQTFVPQATVVATRMKTPVFQDTRSKAQRREPSGLSKWQPKTVLGPSERPLYPTPEARDTGSH